jgi:hypothetical protein
MILILGNAEHERVDVAYANVAKEQKDEIRDIAVNNKTDQASKRSF